jgi:hypothetical protein
MLAVSNELPVSRVKKIIQLDDDIVQCSNNATFVIAMATVRRILHLLYFVPRRLMSSIGDVHPVSR